MRDIKFRGKRIDNGEWVYVYLLNDFGGDTWIVNTTQDIKNANTENVWQKVDPNTIGRYTGLKDKNGKEIYEKDIVCDRWANFYTPIFRNGIYMAYNVEDLKQEPSTQFNVIWKNGCEVVGNIHENPELMEGKK